MNMHWSLSKTDCTIEEYILKLWENTTFHNSNINHEVRNNYQVTFIFMKNQGKSLVNTEMMFFMNMHQSSSKTDCTIEESISKLWENTHIHNSNISHDVRNIYQVTLIFMENQRKKLINTEKMVFDEHAFLVLIKNKLHH